MALVASKLASNGGTKLSPLRYPGGKAKLACFMQSIFEDNVLTGGIYAEPYAGGAAIALKLLSLGYVSKAYLNDLSPTVYAFWRAVLEETEDLCRLISDTAVTVEEWLKQREIQRYPSKHANVKLGFSTFFLNRTNRSGIIKGGGVIGGLAQSGEWKLDVRYNKAELVKRIQSVAEHRTKITLSNLDAEDFIQGVANTLPGNTLIYLDPPYYVKGHRLYENHYKPSDHRRVATLIQSELQRPWVVSYDDCSEIRGLYEERKLICYGIPYSAADKRTGTEVMFLSDDLTTPLSLDSLPTSTDNPPICT